MAAASSTYQSDGTMDDSMLRVGIMSAARIAAKVVREIQTMDGIKLWSVASRSAGKGVAFADEHKIGMHCTYDELVADRMVQAVYIPLPTGLAADWAVRCAESGKHVLVDKPFVSQESVQRVVDACARNNVVFMDGTHFVHGARFRLMKAQCASAKLAHARRRSPYGQTPSQMTQLAWQYPSRITTNFCYPVDVERKGEIRADASLEPSGALGDLGWYNARAAVSIFGPDVCMRIKTAACDAVWHDELNCIIEAVGFVRFENGCSYHFSVSFAGPLQQTLEVTMPLGSVRMDDFVLPSHSTPELASTNVPIPTGPPSLTRPSTYRDEKLPTFTVLTSGRCNQRSGKVDVAQPRVVDLLLKDLDADNCPRAMIEEFVRLARKPNHAGTDKWARETIATQRILDALLADAVSRRLQTDVQPMADGNLPTTAAGQAPEDFEEPPGARPYDVDCASLRRVSSIGSMRLQRLI